MIRKALVPLFMAMSILPQGVFCQDSNTTLWKGALDTGGRKLRLELDITDTGGALTGELRSLDQGNVALALADIRIDEDSLVFSVPRVGASFTGVLTEHGTIATGTFSQGGTDLPLTFYRSDATAALSEDGSDGELVEAWVGKLQAGAVEMVMQFRVVKMASGEKGVYFDSVTERQTGFEANHSMVGDTLIFEVPSIRLIYRGTLNEAGDEAEGMWNQSGGELPLNLKKQATEYDDVNVWENRPQRPVGPFPYDAEEVTFDNRTDSLTLAGTLTIPSGPGTYPAVVLISGSGAQDRDESLMGHKPFLVLADYLSRRGIAVLRYDDRGTAGSTGVFATATSEDFARDASAAVEFLTNHVRINPSQIGLAGHSEGGLIAPMVAGLRDDVAFVVLLAGTGVDGVSVLSSQSEAILRTAGTDESEIEMATAINRAVYGVVTRSSPGQDLAADIDAAVDSLIQTIDESEREEAARNVRSGLRGQMAALQSNWFRFFLSYDPRPALRNITCPVLAINGSKDLQVLPDLNLPEIRRALAEGGNTDFEVIELDGLNHLFQRAETGAVSEYASIQETFSPAALAVVGDWIVKHTIVAE